MKREKYKIYTPTRWKLWHLLTLNMGGVSLSTDRKSASYMTKNAKSLAMKLNCEKAFNNN